jgi:hypothetical protein
VLVEQAGVSLYLVLLLGLMLLSLAAALRWRWSRGPATAPLLLLPGWATLLRILGLGVLLPLAAFYGYTRWSGLSGRECGFSYLGHRFVLELVLLGATVLLLARGMATRAIRRRCEALGIAVPPVSRWRRRAAWAAVAALWLACVLMGELGAPGSAWAEPLLVAGALAVGVVGAIALSVRYVLGRRGCGLYCGTAARSLIPVFAAAILVLAAVAHPVLRASEVRLLRADSLLFSSDAASVSFTRAEALMVERLKKGVQRAAAELDGGP